MHHLHHRVRETLILDSYLLVGLPNKTQAVGDGSTFIHLPHIDNGNTLSITLYLANVAKLGLTKEANLAINNPTDNNHITPLSRSTFNNNKVANLAVWAEVASAASAVDVWEVWELVCR
jgi:hypothetical protein